MNDFQIKSKLGEGAYSVVHKVIRNADNQVYALKKVKLLNLSEKEKLNALNEIRILASIKSKFVASYKEAFFDENEQCLGIVMEYAEKGDLYQKICEYKKSGIYFDESDIWRIFIQMVKGLKALHDLKILHRDLKSANIFLFNDGSAKIGDLNVSKVAKRGVGYTQTGTPYYASPEVWKDQPYDLKSDIWSLGCVLFEIITLKPPFRAENMEGLYNKVIKGQFSKIPDRFSSDLNDIVRLLLQVQPETRPNCDQILKHPHILKRMEKNFEEEEFPFNNNLLQTIRIPKNLLVLTEKLPKANYNLEDKNEFLVEKKKKKKKESKIDMIQIQESNDSLIDESKRKSRPIKAGQENSPVILKELREKSPTNNNNNINNIIRLNDNNDYINQHQQSPNYRKEDQPQPKYKSEEIKMKRNSNSNVVLPSINIGSNRMQQEPRNNRNDYHSVERELLLDLRKGGSNKYDSSDKSKIIKILKNVNQEQIYKIYGVGSSKNNNNIIKNKIDRAGMRYDLYKPKKFISDNHIQQKINLIPRKLSPLRK